MLALLLLACTVDPPVPPPAAVPAPAPAAPVAAPAPDPAAFGDKVLVILSSSLQPGVDPAGLVDAAAEPGVTLARLDSTAFKGLMPCYEIVVAGAFADVAAARELSGRLKARGVEHYLKPAGAWVGARPELDRACSARRAPPAPGSTVAFVEGPGARLSLDPALEVEVLSRSPPVLPVDEAGTAWAAPLTVHGVAPWTVGDALVGVTAAGEVVGCTLERFLKGVSGTPHFGWVQDGPQDRPGCGDEHLYAKVDCDAVLVLPTGSAPLTARPMGAVSTAAPADLPLDWDLQVRQQQGLGSERGTVQVAWEVQPLRLGEAGLRRVSVRLWTGEGNTWCGAEDFAWSAVGLLDEAGKPVLALRETTGWQVGPVLSLSAGASPAVHLREELTGSQRLVGEGLDVGVEVPYCDCPC